MLGKALLGKMILFRSQKYFYTDHIVKEVYFIQYHYHSGSLHNCVKHDYMMVNLSGGVDTG